MKGNIPAHFAKEAIHPLAAPLQRKRDGEIVYHPFYLYEKISL